MAPFDHTVHHTVKTREGSQPGAATPFLQLNGPGGSIVLIQRGKFYDGGGFEIADGDLPDWVRASVQSLSQEACDSVGIQHAGGGKDMRRTQGAPGLDIAAAVKAPRPMQLNAPAPGSTETPEKAEPVPQDDPGWDEDEDEKTVVAPTPAKAPPGKTQPVPPPRQVVPPPAKK